MNAGMVINVVRLVFSKTVWFREKKGVVTNNETDEGVTVTMVKQRPNCHNRTQINRCKVTAKPPEGLPTSEVATPHQQVEVP